MFVALKMMHLGSLGLPYQLYFSRFSRYLKFFFLNGFIQSALVDWGDWQQISVRDSNWWFVLAQMWQFSAAAKLMEWWRNCCATIFEQHQHFNIFQQTHGLENFKCFASTQPLEGLLTLRIMPPKAKAKFLRQGWCNWKWCTLCLGGHQEYQESMDPLLTGDCVSPTFWKSTCIRACRKVTYYSVSIALVDKTTWFGLEFWECPHESWMGTISRQTHDLFLSVHVWEKFKKLGTLHIITIWLFNNIQHSHG